MQTCLNCGKLWDATAEGRECPACGWDAPAPASPVADAPTPAEIPADPFGAPPPPPAPPPTVTAGPAPGGQAPPPPNYGTPPKTGMSTTAKVLIGVGAGLLLLLIAAVVAGIFLVRQATDFVEEAGGADFFGGTAAVDLDVGDCYSMTGESVVPTSCSSPHTHEVFALVPWTQGSGYPSEMDVFAEVFCDDQFQDYVGIDYFESVLFYETARPTESAWDAGDHNIRCVLYEPGTQLSASERGSAR